MLHCLESQETLNFKMLSTLINCGCMLNIEIIEQILPLIIAKYDATMSIQQTICDCITLLQDTFHTQNTNLSIDDKTRLETIVMKQIENETERGLEHTKFFEQLTKWWSIKLCT